MAVDGHGRGIGRLHSLPHQDAVTVGDHRSGGQLYDTIVAFLLENQRMGWALDGAGDLIAQIIRSGALDGDIQGKSVSRIAQQGQRLAPGIGRAQFVLTHKAWGCRQRHAQHPAQAIGAGKLDIRCLDRHILVGPNAGHLQGEDIGRFARQQRSLMAGFLGRSVFGLGLFSLFQAGGDFDIAEVDIHPSHRGIAGQGKAVDGLQHGLGLGTSVAERLPQGQRSQWSADAPAEVRLFEGDEPGMRLVGDPGVRDLDIGISGIGIRGRRHNL